MKSYCSFVCFLLAVLGYHGSANAYLGCPKPTPCIYYTDTTAIKAIDVNTSNYPNTILHTVVNAPAYAIDLDMTADMVYWSERSPSWRIRRMNLSNGNIEDLITKDLGEVEGVAVDWVNRKLYWTDLTYVKVEVSTLDGLYRKTLYNKDDKSAGVNVLHNPKAIAVHPEKGYLFWTDYHYYYPQLARSTLAGTDYKMIRDFYFTDHYLPTGLSIDYTKNRLYVIDAFRGTIESFDLDGLSRIEHHTAGHAPYPADMTLLGNVAYWADLKSHSVERVNRTYWVRLLSFGWLGDKAPRGVVGYNSSYQKPANTSCTRNNGGCSHLCLTTPNGRQCACPNGVKLLSNNLNCSNITNIVPPPQPPVVSVRLVNGRFPSEGRVEVSYSGLYGTVCDDYFGYAEADVVCKMLNYSRATHVFKRAYYGEGSGVIWLDSVKCKGNEKSISECQHDGWGENDCLHGEDVGVRCDNGTSPENVTSPYTNTTGLKVRLIGGLEEYEGRVEVFYQNEWGTICDRRWTLQDAHVVCRMQGYEGAWGAQGYAYFGPGTGSRIMVSDLACTGNEPSIGLCYSSGWGNPTCTHDYDVSVTCKAHPSKVIDSATVRLRDGLTPNEGRVEIKHKGKWGTICDDWWDIADANVVCRQLGYPAAFTAPPEAAFGQGRGSIMLSLFRCKGNENTLQDCQHSEWGASICTHSEDASVVCRTNQTKNPQDSSSFLLVADQKRGFLRQIIHQSDYRNHSSFPYVIQAVSNPDFLAIDPVARSVYVSDGSSIYMARLFQNTSTRIISQGQRISGLAVDYVCKKLYWSDNAGNRIMVSSLDGSSARGLVSVDSPKGLVLDIKGGVMYYIGGYPSSKICISHMDGSNNKTLITLTSSPTSIAHDSSNNILYWSDSDKILYLNLSSNVMSAKLLSSVHVSRPYGLAFHAGYLYWTDLKSGSFNGGLYRARLTSSSSHVTEFVLSGLMTPRGVASVDLNNFLPENFTCNKCHLCQQMCLRIPSGQQCVCSGIYRLNSDKKTCSISDFFAFTDFYKDTAEIVPADASDGNAQRTSIPLKNSILPRAIEWDPVEHRIYYSDTSKSVIARLYLNGTSQEVIVSNVIQPTALAIDHIGRNLYFVDFSGQSVSVCKLDGSNRKTLQTTPGNSPAAIAVHSETGYLYWATWSTKSRIHRALMDGTDHTVLVDWVPTFSSYGATEMNIDKPSNRLYWVGWHETYIEYIDLNQRTPMISQIRSYSSYLWMPGGIAVTPNRRLCWTDQYKESLFCGNENGTSKVQTIVKSVPGIKGLHYCKAKPQTPSAHPCANSNGQCSNLCLLKPNGYSCACPDALPPNTTCSTFTATTTKIPTTAATTTAAATTAAATTAAATAATTAAAVANATTTVAAATTTEKPTTIQKPTTTPSPPTQPPTSEETCKSNPCLNGGTCKPTANSYECICPDYFVPPWSCEVFVGEEVVTVTINGITPEEAEDVPNEFKIILALILNERQSKARRKRAVESQRKITADNIYIVSKPKQEGNQINLEIVVIYPSADGNISTNNIMPAQTLTQAVADSKEQINENLQKKFSNVKVSKVEATPHYPPGSGSGSRPRKSRKVSSGTIAGVVVVILLLIFIAIVVLIYYSRKRTQSLTLKNEEPVPGNDFATFTNPGYGMEQSGNLGSPLSDSIDMSPNVNAMENISNANNPTYEIMMENPGNEYKEKNPEPQAEWTPRENQYSEVPAKKNQEDASTLTTGMPENKDDHQYQSLSWERFDDPPEYENFSGGTLILDQPEDDATA